MPHVINRHAYAYVEGVGPVPTPKQRPKKGKNTLPQPWVYVGRGTPCGNPYVFQRGDTREDLLRSYRVWLWKQIEARNYGVLLQLRSITEGTALVCSCAPKPCHADVLVRAWTWAKQEGLVP